MKANFMTRMCLLTVSLFASVNTPCLAADRHAPASHAVVFMYHHFGEPDVPTTNVTIDQFKRHIEWLGQEGFNVWPLDRIVEQVRHGRMIPDKTISITIDDAYVSVYSRAFPLLKSRNWPFTVFVSTDAVDQQLPAYMTWEQMREMQQHGATFANHSATHEHLIRMHPDESLRQWKRRVTADIKHAQARLEGELGNALPLFAYPYGEYNKSLATIVADLGYTGFGQQSGAIGPYSDPRILPRYPMAEAFAQIREFKTKALSLPLPVTEVTPWDPQLQGDVWQPLMTVTLASSDARQDQLVCYISGQGEVEVTWLDKERFSVRAQRPLPVGRSRYNCTAPAEDSGRFYWFSHLWIRS